MQNSVFNTLNATIKLSKFGKDYCSPPNMKKSNSFYDVIDQIVTHGVVKGILHLHNDDVYFNGNSIILKGNKVVNFGSCSYLGLEFDERLKEAAKQAIDNYGTQFSESRAYVSLGLYHELEGLFRIFSNIIA